jgi:hypothetical protein
VPQVLRVAAGVGEATVTAAEAVLELAELWEDDDAVLRKRRADERAELLESLASEVREVVSSHMSPRVSLAELSARTGYSADTLRAKAHELRSAGLSRKMGGQWCIERTAASRIRPKRQRQERIRPEEMRDSRALARRLAAEE